MSLDWEEIYGGDEVRGKGEEQTYLIVYPAGQVCTDVTRLPVTACSRPSRNFSLMTYV